MPCATRFVRGACLVTLAALAIVSCSQKAASTISPVTPESKAAARSAPPIDVTYCELAANPKSFHQARVRITGHVSFEFERFTLSDPACTPPKDSSLDLWITYGGDVPSGAIYCCPGEGGPPGSRSAPSANVEFPLVADGTYQRFRDFLERTGDVQVRVTLVGKVLIKPEKQPGQLMAGGYGHMGCCSLFVIEQVESFDSRERPDLDYTSNAGFYEVTGCHSGGYSWDFDYEAADVLRQQRDADAGVRSWAFNSPERVALEAIHAKFGAADQQLVRVKAASGRQVFEWRRGKTYSTVIVIRPGWLAHFAKTKAVVWAATFIITAACAVEIKPDEDIRTQVLAAFKRDFDPRADAALSPDLLARLTRIKEPAPKNASFFRFRPSHVVAVELDEQGWPILVDVRFKSSYPVAAEAWGKPEFWEYSGSDIPLSDAQFRAVVYFLDALRPFGPEAGKLQSSGTRRTQVHENATLTWEDGSRMENGAPYAVASFSVRWGNRR